MTHRAYPFDYGLFSQTFKPVLLDALDSGSAVLLAQFIDENYRQLRSPYDGSPVFSGWRKLFDASDVQVCGDVAMTKFYDPMRDIGLGGDWIEISECLCGVCPGLQGSSPVLGQVIGRTVLFDPGRMGSYFQDISSLKSSLRCIDTIGDAISATSFAQVRSMLEEAIESGPGLFVSF